MIHTLDQNPRRVYGVVFGDLLIFMVKGKKSPTLHNVLLTGLEFPFELLVEASHPSGLQSLSWGILDALRTSPDKVRLAPATLKSSQSGGKIRFSGVFTLAFSL